MFYSIFVCAHYQLGRGLSGSVIALSPPPILAILNVSAFYRLQQIRGCFLFLLWAEFYKLSRTHKTLRDI